MDDFSCLEKICPYCYETGTVVNPEFTKWQINECVDKCPEKMMIRCPICKGTCLVPTKMGISILELVRIYNKEENNENE